MSPTSTVNRRRGLESGQIVGTATIRVLTSPFVALARLAACVGACFTACFRACVEACSRGYPSVCLTACFRACLAVCLTACSAVRLAACVLVLAASLSFTPSALLLGLSTALASEKAAASETTAASETPPPASSPASPQASKTAAASETQKIEAVRVDNGGVIIDGILSESVWQRPGTSGFKQLEPDEGSPATFPTEVWLAYDDEALYVAARLHDPGPDSIITRLSRRDEWDDSDCLEVDLDTFHDHLTGFAFSVNPSGSIADQTLYNDSWRDQSWDGVWESTAKIDKDGWTAEMRIPFSQLRFHDRSDCTWGINFARRVERRHEVSSFVFYPTSENRYVSLFAHLIGITGIKPSRRMELLPYAVGRGEFLQVEEGDPFDNESKYRGAAGLDFKLGLGSNLTLDGTVNPDFGQVEVDPAVVNLSQYETFYQEKRPFFIEGSDIFLFGMGGSTSEWNINWQDPSFFYSRRIGRVPQGNEPHDCGDCYVDLPDATTILGAGKLSGKLPGGWSLGLLQAVTDKEYAETDSLGVRFKDEAEPLTSYTILRGQKDFRQGMSSLGFIGTSVIRDIEGSYLRGQIARRAFSTGLDGWVFLDKDKDWVVTGYLGGSRVEGNEEAVLALQEDEHHYFQRPDAKHVEVDPDATSLSGWAGKAALNKQKGNTTVNIAWGAISPGFETNDAGFHWKSDISVGHAVVGYNWFNPGKIFRRKGVFLAAVKGFDFGGRKTGDGYLFFTRGEFANYWSFECNGGWFPSSGDNYLTRGGPLAKEPAGRWAELEFNSDSRKSVEFGGFVEIDGNEAGSKGLYTEAWISLKPSSNIGMTLSPSYGRQRPVAQYVDSFEDALALGTYGSRYVFADMDEQTVSIGLRLNCTFTPRTSLQLFAQPLIAAGDYSRFKEFAKPSGFEFREYGRGGSTIAPDDGGYLVDPDGPGPADSFWFENPDFNYKSLRLNTVFRCEYRPGSTIYLVWTQMREKEEDFGSFDVSRDFKNLFKTRPENIFLFKVTYWLSL